MHRRMAHKYAYRTCTLFLLEPPPPPPPAAAAAPACVGSPASRLDAWGPPEPAEDLPVLLEGGMNREDEDMRKR
jgi:hypothetical protein